VIERTGASNFFSSGTLLRERYGSVLGNEMVIKSGEKMRVVSKPTVSLYIYGRPYN
jgi:hypothetical protein